MGIGYMVTIIMINLVEIYTGYHVNQGTFNLIEKDTILNRIKFKI